METYDNENIGSKEGFVSNLIYALAPRRFGNNLNKDINFRTFIKGRYL